MAVANGFRRVLVGQNGILSTPAASAVIRMQKCPVGGLILSASHNPGGPNGDFGIKWNIENGGPAPEHVTNAIYKNACSLTHYKTLADTKDFDLSKLGSFDVLGTEIVVFDSVLDWANLQASLFDFAAIRKLFASGFRMRFDAMHAVTGPYARRVFVSNTRMAVWSSC